MICEPMVMVCARGRLFPMIEPDAALNVMVEPADGLFMIRFISPVVKLARYTVCAVDDALTTTVSVAAVLVLPPVAVVTAPCKARCGAFTILVVEYVEADTSKLQSIPRSVLSGSVISISSVSYSCVVIMLIQ